MPSGELFTAPDRQRIAEAVALAERVSGRGFSVHVGASQGDDSREYAERLLASLSGAADRVLIHLDPVARRLEIVTGARVRAVVTNRQTAVAAVTMQSHLQDGDLVGAIVAGLQQLGGLARAPRTLHSNEPRRDPAA